MFRPLFILAFVFLLPVNASIGEPTDSDRVQRQVNEEAYANRFAREFQSEQATGIEVSEEQRSDGEFTARPNWKMILMTGDDSIRAFDNARKKLFALFSEYGVDEGIQLSRNPREQVDGVRATSIPNFEKATLDLSVQDGDGCIVFMTSHGTTAGFYIRGQGHFAPSKFNQIIHRACGSRPTVLLVSACYSGIFAEPSLQAPNRVILTAARKDKTSFGCSAEAEYTYWDGCLIETLPSSITWFELAQKVEKCIERKETVGGFARSYPQARFGAQVTNLEIR